MLVYDWQHLPRGDSIFNEAFLDMPFGLQLKDHLGTIILVIEFRIGIIHCRHEF